MIKLDKDINAIPVSLIPAFDDLFSPNRIPQTVKTTHKRRLNIIAFGSYIDDNNHNSRYKTSDIKEALNEIYNGKCAYCEQKLEQFQVEHYRPKSIYHWLAYSWDNLISACGKCNQGKGNNFSTLNNRVSFLNNEGNLRTINSNSLNYDVQEQPLMINPEVTNPLGLISFDRSGCITSNDQRFAYTIEICKIDRAYLNDQRRKILDDFKRDVQSILVENADNTEQQRIEIGAIVKKFIRDSIDNKNPYLAYRKFAIGSQWLNDIIKEQN